MIDDAHKVRCCYCSSYVLLDARCKNRRGIMYGKKHNIPGRLISCEQYEEKKDVRR